MFFSVYKLKIIRRRRETWERNERDLRIVGKNFVTADVAALDTKKKKKNSF